MDKNLKQLNKEIRSGKHLEENIPQFFNRMAEDYHTYASVGLAMHYFAFYEAYCDDENTWGKEAIDYTARLNGLIKEHILKTKSGAEREEAIREADLIRKEITIRMDALTTYADIFQIYEYVLNRVEYRFSGEAIPFNEEEFAKEILRYIFDTQDNFIINEKIKDIIGQTPIRMTKQKYFELVKDSIHAYLGADTSSLDTYLYLLKTSAMLYHVDGMETIYPALWDKKEALSKLEYKNITKEDYDKAKSYLQAATLMLEIETTIYFSLQEIVNEIYSLLLCSPYADMITSDHNQSKEAALSILSEINQEFIKLAKEELTVEIMEQFVQLEGIQEELSYQLSLWEDMLFEVNTNYKSLTESLMLEPLLQVLLLTKNLLSNSLFINLEDKPVTEEIVDEEMIDKVVKDLEAELTLLFGKEDRMVSRAVMANTISKMPVFFADHKEVMDYVLYSLEHCQDIHEKAACYEIINDIMSE